MHGLHEGQDWLFCSGPGSSSTSEQGHVEAGAAEPVALAVSWDLHRELMSRSALASHCSHLLVSRVSLYISFPPHPTQSPYGHKLHSPTNPFPAQPGIQVPLNYDKICLALPHTCGFRELNCCSGPKGEAVLLSTCCPSASSAISMPPAYWLHHHLGTIYLPHQVLAGPLYTCSSPPSRALLNPF